jgi:hypothetical protein
MEQQEANDNVDPIQARPEGRVVWSKPHPHSVYRLAAEAMDQADDKILATAFRKLAKADPTA